MADWMRSIRAKTIVSGLVAAAVLLVIASPADAQCAMCRAALESSDAQAFIAKLNLGILFLLAAPMGIVVSIAIAMARSRRRLRSAEEA